MQQMKKRTAMTTKYRVSLDSNIPCKVRGTNINKFIKEVKSSFCDFNFKSKDLWLKFYEL